MDSTSFRHGSELALFASDPADALAEYARSWPDLAGALVGGQAIGDGETFREILHGYLDAFLRGQSTGPELSATVAAMRSILDHESAGQFKLALAADARTASSERMAAGIVHSIWGVTPLVNLGAMRAAARRLGMVAESFCYQPYHVTSDFDVLLSKQYEWALKDDVIAYSWLAFTWAMLRYDVFHTYYDRGLLLPVGGYGSANYGVNVEEMQLLQLAGKRLYCLAYGADNRTRNRTLASDPVNFCMHCPAPRRYCICDDAEAEKMFAVIDQYTTANLASGLSTDYVPNSYELHYLVFDTDAVKPEPVDRDYSQPLRVFHAPNHPHFKGSHYLMDAVADLRREGVAIELQLLTGAPQVAVLEAMRSADIVADQFIGGFYGQTAIEAMAHGRPVMCFIREPQRVAAPDELPIINCRPDAIKETLRALTERRSSLEQIGAQSRAYVERHHSLAAFAHRLRRLYVETAKFPDTIRLVDVPSPATGGIRPMAQLNRTQSAEMLAARAEMRGQLEEMAGALAELARSLRRSAKAREATLERELDEERAAGQRALEEERAAAQRALEEEQAAAQQALEEERAAAQRALEEEQAAHRQALEEQRLARERALEAERAAQERALQADQGMRLAKEAARRAEETNDRLERLRQETEAGLVSVEAEKQDLAQRAARVGAALRQMQASKAWRITLPLRALNHWRSGSPVALKSNTPPLPVSAEVAEATAFLADFTATYGRPLRVLHIGNVADRAYRNANIQRQWGIEADVLCGEDSIRANGAAAFDGVGRERPGWLVQGSLDLSIRYLLAKTKGRTRAAHSMWRWLTFERRLIGAPDGLAYLCRVAIRALTGRDPRRDGSPTNAILLQGWGALLRRTADQAHRVAPALARKLRRSGDRAIRFARTSDFRKNGLGRVGRRPRGRPGDTSDYGPLQRLLDGWRHPYLRLLLDRYDVVQCYGDHAAIPSLVKWSGHFAYGWAEPTAFEQAKDVTRAGGYRDAAAVFVTDVEQLKAARALVPTKVASLPPAVSSEELLRFSETHRPRGPGRLVRFFSPTQQCWVDTDSGAAHGNEEIFHALALVRASGRQCVLHAVEWGRDLAASKQLANNLGVADMIEWKAPSDDRQLWREYVDCDAVIDQFAAPSLGAAACEAMMMGRRTISRIDKEQTQEFFGESPPLYNCTTAGEIAEAMKRAIDDPSDLAADGERNRQWAIAHLASPHILSLQVTAYRDFGNLRVIPGAAAAATADKLFRWGRPFRSLYRAAGRPFRMMQPAALSPETPRSESVLARLRRDARARLKSAAFNLFAASGDLALQAAAPAGRVLSWWRIGRGKARTLWGVTPILTLPLLARCDGLLGLSSKSLVYVTYHTSSNFDINLSKLLERFSGDVRTYHGFTKWVLALALLRFDVFNFFYDRGILLPPNGRIWLAPDELAILKRAGKRVYTYAYGADVRTRETTLALGAYNFCADCPEPRRFCICDETEARRNVEGIRASATAMIAMADMIHYVPGCRNFHYWPLDLDKIKYVGVNWNGDRPLRVLHAPNHMHFKGSRHLFAAVERLRAEGAPIELRTISGVANAEVLQAMAEADVIAEQFIGGAYGYTAVESWAMGKPVLTYARDPSVAPSWEDFPGINTTPPQLYDTLRGLIAGRYDLSEIGRASRRYAEAHYSLEAVAVNIGTLYLETGKFHPRLAHRIGQRVQELHAIQRQRLARPLPSASNNQQRAPLAKSAVIGQEAEARE